MAAPTASLRLSTSNSSFFANETEGDVIMTAGNGTQNILIGQSTSSNAGIQVTSNLVNVAHTINCGELVQSYGLNLSMGSSMLSHDIANLKTDAFFLSNLDVAAATSNALYPRVAALEAALEAAGLIAAVVIIPASLFSLNASSLSVANASLVSSWTGGSVAFTPNPGYGENPPTYYATGGGLSDTLPYVNFNGHNNGRAPTTSLYSSSPITLNAGANGGFTYVKYVNYPTAGTGSYGAFFLGGEPPPGGTASQSSFFVTENSTGAVTTLGYTPNIFQIVNVGGQSPMTGDGVSFPSEFVGLSGENWGVLAFRYSNSPNRIEMFWVNAPTSPTTLTNSLKYAMVDTNMAPAVDDTFAYASINNNYDMTSGLMNVNYIGLWDRPLNDAQLSTVINSVLAGTATF